MDTTSRSSLPRLGMPLAGRCMRRASWDGRRAMGGRRRMGRRALLAALCPVVAASVCSLDKTCCGTNGEWQTVMKGGRDACEIWRRASHGRASNKRSTDPAWDRSQVYLHSPIIVAGKSIVVNIVSKNAGCVLLRTSIYFLSEGILITITMQTYLLLLLCRPIYYYFNSVHQNRAASTRTRTPQI
jgi:hypothetical protein